jgi:uncharacterized membrane protein
MSASLAAQPGRARHRPRGGWYVVAVLAALIALYALAYVVVGPPMYPPNLAASFRARPWGIYPHALFGALALGLGAAQFHPALVRRRRALHRALGKVYVGACLLVGAAGLYMAWYAYGGPASRAGFGALAVLLLGTTWAAFAAARRRDIATHRAWMLRSYALIFAAVTLRIELPLLIVAFGGDFDPAYRVVAWLCWVPNLLWAELWLRRRALEPGVLAELRTL